MLVLEQEHYNLAQGDYNLVLEHCSLVLVLHCSLVMVLHCSLVLVLEQGYCSLV